MESVEAAKEEAYNTLKQEIDDLTQEVMEKETMLTSNETSVRSLEKQLNAAEFAHEQAVEVLKQQVNST